MSKHNEDMELPMKQILDALDALIDNYTYILNTNLIGIYLHGSLAMGCFNPASSDIDLLVVIKEELCFREKRALIDVILNMSSKGIKNDFEMSVILEADAKHFSYPTHFVLHYSSTYKERYINDPGFLCENGVDPDLASHITILANRGICLAGKPISEVFGPVEEKHYLESILADVRSANDGILDSPVYYILNLCRVLYFLREKVVASKKEGGEWELNHLAFPHKDIVQSALSSYLDTKNTLQVEQSKLIEFAEYMLKEIVRASNMPTDTYHLIERKPTAIELVALRQCVGWGASDIESFSKGLDNSLYGVCAFDGDEIIGTARVVGDGATVFYVQDVIVKPNYQRMGIGRAMMEKVMHYIGQNACAGAVVGLMSAKGKEDFYKGFGFWERPNENYGAGMMQFWNRNG